MANVAQQIVASARSYIGTPFAHQGRRKRNAHDKGGVDCLGLLVGVARECGLSKSGVCLACYDETDYGHIPNGTRLQSALKNYLHPVSDDVLLAGDVVLMRIDHHPQHLGIIGDYKQTDMLSLIHAYAPARAVVEHRLDAHWQSRIVMAYRYGGY